MKSHLVPQGVYRRIQRAYAEPVNSLVRIDPQAQTSALISNQLQELLLCEACERRLKCCGEDYFYGLVDEPDKLRIRRAVKLSQALATGASELPIDLTQPARASCQSI